MPRPGGEADKQGNRYESIVTVDCVMDLLDGSVTEIELEPLGSTDADGVELVMRRSSGVRAFLSAKSQAGSRSYSFSLLGASTATKPDGVLGAWVRKLRDDPTAEVVFATQTANGALQELPKIARSSASLAELRRRLRTRTRETSAAGPLDTDFAKLTALCDGDATLAWSIARRLHISVRSEDQLLRDVDRRIALELESDAGLEPLLVRSAIGADFVLGHLGDSLGRNELIAFLNAFGVHPASGRDSGSITTVLRRRTKMVVERARSVLIDGRMISRPESSKLAAAVESHGGGRVFLEGAAGSGKSATLLSYLESLGRSSVPHLAIRLDELHTARFTRDLGAAWGLKESPIVALGRLTVSRPGVVILDQFDALSIVSGRNLDLWSLVREMLGELEWFPNLTAVIACRTFDLEHDQKLAELAKGDDVGRVKVDRLAAESVAEVLGRLGAPSSSFSELQLEMLSLPSNLYLYANIAPDSRRSFATTKDLLDQYWQTKENAVLALTATNGFAGAIQGLCEALSLREQLSVPVEALDGSPVKAALLSESVLILDGSRVAFFHETFFDYAFARGFAREGKGLSAWLLENEQSIFRRSQVRQVLEYRRDGDFELYLADLESLLRNEGIRAHIKHLVVDWLSSLGNPSFREWEILEASATGGPSGWQDSVYAALRNRVPWFQILERNATWKHWLDSADVSTCNRAVWLLSMPDVIRECGDQVGLLSRLPITRLSSKGRRRLGELQRKHGLKSKSDAIHVSHTGWVGSPIPGERVDRLSDGDWLGAVSKYTDDETRWSGLRAVGGARHLAQELKRLSAAEPQRFARLMAAFPPRTNALYFGAVAEGLSEAAKSGAAEASLAWDAIRLAHRQEGTPCGSEVVRAIRNLVEQNPPRDIVETLCWYATEDPDPAQERDMGEVRHGRLQSLWSFGAVRESAAWTLGAMISVSPELFAVTRASLFRLAEDPISRVRACAVQAYLAGLFVDPTESIALFLHAIAERPQCWSTPPVEQFLHHAVFRDYGAVRPLLVRMLGSESEGAVIAAGRQICVAALSQDEARADAEVVRSGTAAQRRAAAEVYASNAGGLENGEECRGYVQRFFSDENKEVREAATWAFGSIDPDEVPALIGLIGSLVDSPAFIDGLDNLVNRLRLTTALPAELVANLGLRASIAMGPEAGDLSTHAAAIAHELSALVVRAYEQSHTRELREKLLDAIDGMVTKGFMGVREGLDTISRE